MGSIHFYEAEFSSMAQEVLMEDEDARAIIKSLVAKKDLKGTLDKAVLTARPAQTKNILSDMEMHQLAYEIFAHCIEEVTQDEKMVQKMATTVQRKLMAKFTDQPQVEKLKKKKSALSPLPQGKMDSTNISTPEKPKGIDLHRYKDQFGKIALNLVANDPNFKTFLTAAITSSDLKRTLSYSIKKAESFQEQYSLDTEDIFKLSYELFATVFSTARFPDEKKQKMAETIHREMEHAVKKTGETASHAPVKQPQPHTRLEIQPTTQSLNTAAINTTPKTHSMKTPSSHQPETTPSINKPSLSQSSAPNLASPKQKEFGLSAVPALKKPAAIKPLSPSPPSLSAMSLKTSSATPNVPNLFTKTQSLETSPLSDVRLSTGPKIFSSGERAKPEISTAQPPLPAKGPKIFSSRAVTKSASVQQTGSHLYYEEFGIVAAKIADNQLKLQIIEAIQTKQLKKTLQILIKKVRPYQKQQNLSFNQAMKLTYELFALIFTDMKIEPLKKQKMGETVQKRIEMYYEKQEQKSTGALYEVGTSTSPNNASIPAPKSSGPKIFNSSVLSGTSESKDSSQAPATNGNSPGTLLKSNKSEKERMRYQREALRQQRKGQQKEPTDVSSIDTSKRKKKQSVEGFDPMPRLDKWLRSDRKFLENVKKFEKMGPDKIRIIYDPDSDGIVAYVDLDLQVQKFGGKFIIQIKASAYSGQKYPYSLAIGKIKRKLVAGTLAEDKIPENEFEILEQLSNVDFKNQLDWDRLMVIVNNDKELLKAIKKLILKNPANPKEEILIPLIIEKNIPSNKIIVKTFITLNLKPSTLFIDIIDEIAERMEVLGADDDGDDVTSSLSSRFSTIDENKFDVNNYKFHYLDKDDSVSFKSCPYCGKPYPNPDADYRRCPNCLEKLK